jgi:protocatechuate 3,4-dioxygenase beta subunit
MRILSRKRRIVWLFLSSAAAIGLAQESDSRSSVSGRVTNSANGAPVPHAHVSLYPLTAGNRQSHGALTGADGKFFIAQLPPGEYEVSVNAAGFQSPPVVPDARTDRLILRPAEHKDDLDLALTPFGAISGRVLDAGGLPMQGVWVSALGIDGLTDGDVSAPDGQYRLAGLPPGKYRVRAAPNSVTLPPEIRTDGSAEVRYASTYYPASLAVESAARLEVAPGAERTGIDIRLLRAPIVAVRGTVSGIPAGVPGIGIGLRKVEPPRAPSIYGGGMMPGYAHRVNPDGSFVIWGLDPGSYILDVGSNGAGWESPTEEVTVAGKDVSGVALRMVRMPDISGQILLDDDRAQFPRVPPNAPLGDSPRIGLQELKSGGGPFSVVAADGSFHLAKFPPGQYHVHLSWGAYAKSMRLGPANIEGALLDLRNGSEGASLTVTASSATARISGVVRDAAGPAAYARVAMMLEEIPHTERVLSAGAGGVYTFVNISPGRYKLLALDAGVVYGLAIRDQLEDYADLVETVEVHPGDRLTLDLRRRASNSAAK